MWEALCYGAGPVGGSEGSTRASDGIIRLIRRKNARFFAAGIDRSLAVKGHMKNDGCNRCDRCNYKDQHDGDKPGGAALILRRWLSDAKRVNEGIRQKKQRAHGDWMITEGGRIGLFVHPER